jgi:hypothetical protein
MKICCNLLFFFTVASNRVSFHEIFGAAVKRIFVAACSGLQCVESRQKLWENAENSLHYTNYLEISDNTEYFEMDRIKN